MLPPILRTKFLQSFLNALLVPLNWLYDRFKRMGSEADAHLMSNGQSISIVDAIIREYDLYQGDVYITENRDNAVYFHFTDENALPVMLNKQEDEKPLLLAGSDEGNWEADFYIHIPSFLKDDLKEITRIINHYKPAGRRYLIKFYEYE